ncbi:MAG: iron-sulfur cluster-binding protein, partial [Proteobacteria bacterium]|nr:iron-sulfur cluster-binding protein [Pseudomonadota bacterium]
MQPTSANFIANARDAIADDNLQLAIARVGENFGAKRQQAVDKLPEFDALCGRAVEIKDDVLAHLDYYLEVYERAVTASGGHVHWCATVEEACETVLRLCRSVDAKTVTKGKSMIGEEMEINPYLERHGIEPIETDLGEYIIQLAGEPPSHIIAPAVHKTKEQVTDLFHEHHRKFGKTERLTEGEDLVAEARELLRGKYLAADVGITGANFLIAETGSSIIVTNEGNGDLTQMLPKMHIVLASLEKVVPTLEDAATLLRLLARSASGQEMSSYTTLSTGPRRADDPDGPGEYHVVLLDGGRSELLGGEFQDILRCIRCGACYNHCPVYTSVGGHAYGWVYGGPMGAVLTPALIGLAEARHLPSATPFCGRCEEVCPMQIPLPKMMRHWREQSFQRRLTPGRERLAVALWAWFARRPALYHLGARFAIGWLFRRARGRGHMR